MSDILNSSLGPVAISKETNATLGVPSKDFAGGNTAFYIEQDLDAPIASQDDVEKVVKKTTRGNQVQSQKDVMRGKEMVTLNFGNNVSKVDFATVIMPMFFPHSYAYTPTVTDSTITAVSSVTDTVTITVTDIGALQDGDYVVISGRTITAENGTYEVDNISSNSFDITYTGGFDTEIAGVADAQMNTHSSVMEDINDCNKKRRESSFTIYQPYLWDKADCAVGQGYITTGLAPKSLDLDFVASTYTVDMIGKQIIDDSTNLPTSDASYKKPINKTGTYFDSERPVIKDSLGVAQQCLALTLNVTHNLSEDLKVYKAGKFSKVVVDGTTITGSYTLLFDTKELADNYSATIYANRKSTENYGTFTLGLSSADGASVEISSNMSFSNVQKVQASLGWELSMDFEMLYDYDAENITATCINGYNQSMAELFATEA